MGLTVLTQRVRNFAVPHESRCLNCGRMIWPGKGIYEKRFCSVECKDEYCNPIKAIKTA